MAHARQTLARAVAAAPTPRRTPRTWRLPVLRSLIAAAAALVALGGAYIVARQTSVFAVRWIDVRGGTPSVKAEVQKALKPTRGTSLLRLDGSALARRLEALPDVASASFDRSFPHTLVVRSGPSGRCS